MDASLSIAPVNDSGIDESLWVTLQLPAQAPARLLTARPALQSTQKMALHASQLNREQTRLFLELFGRLAQQENPLSSGKLPVPMIQEALQRLQVMMRGQDDGTVAAVSGRVVEVCPQWQLARIQLPGGELWVCGEGFVMDDQIPVKIRARDISLSLSAHADTSVLNVVPAMVCAIDDSIWPGMNEVQLRLGHDCPDGTELTARVSRRSVTSLWLRPGLKLWAQIKSAALAI